MGGRAGAQGEVSRRRIYGE